MALQAETDELELKLSVAKSDRAAAVANLQGEIASLQSRLSRANKAAKEAQEQARAAEARLAQAVTAAEAAAGASRGEEASLRQRLLAAEALAQQQAQQLEALRGEAVQAEQVGAGCLGQPGKHCCRKWRAASRRRSLRAVRQLSANQHRPPPPCCRSATRRSWPGIGWRRARWWRS